MFVRVKPAGAYRYLQIAENYREGKKVKQKVLCTLGRVDELSESGKVDALAQSLLRFGTRLKVIDLHRQGAVRVDGDVSIGPALVFGRLWQELGIAEVIGTVLAHRHFGFDVERAIFLTVLHRLMDPGSDRAAEKWKQDFGIDGAEEIELHQLYRAMGWLGQPTGAVTHPGIPELGVRTTKDRIEELLFARKRDLFSTLSVLFFLLIVKRTTPPQRTACGWAAHLTSSAATAHYRALGRGLKSVSRDDRSRNPVGMPCRRSRATTAGSVRRRCCPASAKAHSGGTSRAPRR